MEQVEVCMNLQTSRFQHALTNTKNLKERETKNNYNLILSNAGIVCTHTAVSIYWKNINL